MSEFDQSSSEPSASSGKRPLRASPRGLELRGDSSDYSWFRDEIDFHDYLGSQNLSIPSESGEPFAQWEAPGISHSENAASKFDPTSGPSTNPTPSIIIEDTSTTSRPSTEKPLPQQLPAWQSNEIRPRPSSRPDSQPTHRTPLVIPRFISSRKTPPLAPIDPLRANRAFTVPSQSSSPCSAPSPLSIPSPSPPPSSSSPSDSEVGVSDADDSDGASREIRKNQRCVFLIGPSPSPISTDFFSRIGECY